MASAVTDALRAETARRIADIRASSEGREGVSSFLEKRKPQWLNERRGAAESSDVQEDLDCESGRSRLGRGGVPMCAA